MHYDTVWNYTILHMSFATLEPYGTHAMRYEPVSKVMHLAVHLQDTRSVLTIDDMETELNASRRTAERLLDSVGQSFGPLEEVETGERRKRWRLRCDALQQFIRYASPCLQRRSG